MLKEFPAPFLFIFSDHFVVPYLSIMETVEMGKKYPFANVKSILYSIWIFFFVNCIHFGQGDKKSSNVKKICKPKIILFKFANGYLFAISSFDMIEKMGSCQSQTPNWIPIHFLFSSLLIWFTIYHWPHPAPTALPNPSTDSSALPVA